MLNGLSGWRFAGMFALLWLCPSALLAVPPQITSLSPRGWKAGVNEVVLNGANFTEKTRLIIDVPKASVLLKTDAKFASTLVKFSVTLPGDVPQGVYQVRLASEDGLSKPEMIVVDSLSTVEEKEPNNSAVQGEMLQLPAGVEGRLSGSESDVFAFMGTKGQRIVAEIAGRRLGANIKPVLRLFNEKGIDIALAQPARRFGNDARLIGTLPADGKYFVELFDLVYKGDNKQYRLLIGELDAADAIFPLGGKSGEKVAFQLMGGTLAKPLLAPFKLDATHGFGPQPLVGVKTGKLSSPFVPVVGAGQFPEVTETAVKDQPLPLPGVVNARISAPGEVDEYVVAVEADEKIRIFVEADRLGSPLDGVIEVKDEKGKPLSTQDDGPGSADPDFLYAVPAGITALRLAIRDGYGRGGETFAYRLGVEPAPEGDFQLVLVDPLVNIPAGGTASIRVRAARREYTGAIRLKVRGDLPMGTKISNAEIPAEATETLLSFNAPSGGAGIQAGTVQIVGEAGPVDRPTLVRAARIDKAADPAFEGAPWLESRLPTAVTVPGLFTMEVAPQEVALLKGMPYVLKVKVRRAADQTGAIKLTLQTTQVQQQLKIQPNQTVPEKADEAEFRLDVPANATEAPLSLVLKGELLDVKTKKMVIGTAEAPALATRVTPPFAIEVPVVKLQPGVRQLVPVKITRLGAFREPIQLIVAGVPANFRSGPAALTAAADAAVVELPIFTPGNQKPTEVKLQVTASWKTTPVLTLPALSVSLPVVDAAPPGLLEVFDDGEDFTAALTEGAGKVALEAKDVYSGKESVLVAAGLKSRAALPGLGVAIAEKPAAGEYRYLRFAWKKKGPGAMALQLAVGNQLNAPGPKGTGYRYVAGLDKAKAIQVAEQPPGEWTVVTRDLFEDHGAFNLTGLSLVGMEGEALFDQIYLGRTMADFAGLKK